MRIPKSDEYITREYFDYRFEVFRKQFRKEINEDFARHTGALLEEFVSRTMVLGEMMQAVIDKLDSTISKYDNRFENHEQRITYMELKDSKS